MCIEENKLLARQFIDRFTANDIAGALDLMTDDATWWLAGKPDHLPASVVFSKEQIGRLLRDMAGNLPKGLKMPVKGFGCGGKKAVMGPESYAELRNGRVTSRSIT